MVSTDTDFRISNLVQTKMVNSTKTVRMDRTSVALDPCSAKAHTPELLGSLRKTNWKFLAQSLLSAEALELLLLKQSMTRAGRLAGPLDKGHL